MKILLFVSLLFLNTPCFAQGTFHWEWCRNPNSNAPDAMGINRNGDLVIAVDNRLGISQDQGQTWITVTLSRFTWNSIRLAFLPSGNILVLRNFNSQLEAGLGADSAELDWVTPYGKGIIPVSKLNFQNLSVNAGGAIIAVQDSNWLLESNSEGLLWDTVPTPKSWNITAGLKTASGSYLILTQFGLFRRAAGSTDWMQSIADTAAPYGDLQQDGGGTIYAFGSSSQIDASTDDGATWSTVPLHWEGNLPAASDGKGTTAFISTNQSLELMRRDMVDTEINAVSGRIYRDSSNNWWLAGSMLGPEGGNWSVGLFRSSDLKTWTTVTFPFGYLNTVFAHSRFIVFDSRYQLNFSTNQGQTWISRQSPIECPCQFQEDSMHRLLLLAGNGGQKSFSSSDTGKTWNPFFGSNSIGMGGMGLAEDGSDNFYATRTVTLVKSIDGGNTWDTLLPANKIVPHLDNNLFIGVVTTPHRVIVGTDSGYLWSADGGRTWNDTVTSTTVLFNGIHLQSRGRTVLGDWFGCMRSTDEGATWKELYQRGYNPRMAIFPSGALLCMTDSVFFVPSDDTTFLPRNDGLEGYDLENMTASIGADGTPYLALPNVGIFRGVGTLAPLGAMPSLPQSRIALYPNPASSASTVSLTLPTSASIRLELFDAMGIKRSTIAEGFYPSGPQEFSIAVKSFAAGIYFLRLTIDGSVTTEHFVVE